MIPENSEKFEALLILALNASENELEKSINLNTGFNKELNTWELIVKSTIPLDRLSSPVIQVESLISGYSIVTIREDFLDAFVALDEVEYIEKPKVLYFT